MPGVAVFCITVAILLLFGTIVLIYRSSGHKMTPRGRQQYWNNVVKPGMKAQHDSLRSKRDSNREALIRSHYSSRIKRAKRFKRTSRLAWLESMADREVALDKRMHGVAPTANKKSHQHMPKIHPKTGLITGGIGREGTKAAHAHNPHPKRMKQPRKTKGQKFSGTKKTLRDIIIGRRK